MADQKFTRCPGCATVFRVTSEQLALREGQVRCGHCRAVFDANSQLVLVDIHAREDEASDELSLGRPTITLRESDALGPVAAETAPATVADDPAAASADVPATDAADVPATDAADVPATDVAAVTPSAVDATPATVVEGTAPGAVADDGAASGNATAPSLDLGELEAARAALRRRVRPRRSGNAFYIVAMLLLVAGLGAQALLQLHDSLAARAPDLRPALASACRWLSCTIRPLRDPRALSIEGSDLQADPAHRGLLILTATVRNRSAYALAYPDLELTLTDASDQVVVRRAFAPSEYLAGGVDRHAGIPGNHEQSIRLFIDASATHQAGYRVYLFYP
ncbi:MAG: zinc-ribbon domain-containing protein [Betaproteobacteria bacterium]|nr:zinc-ribbon domain-containing protein [Betaproteobacteria bacterium]MDE2210340.1 zinc-ribbon domain-containing protein [Betaproteobacteria bacterium]